MELLAPEKVAMLTEAERGVEVARGPVAPGQPPPSAEPPHMGQRRILPLFRNGAKGLATLVMAAIAITLALMTWQYYVVSPWTRNGVVRVQVASVAPQVSGQIITLPVVDNQFVRQGDVLYQIDPSNFEVAVRSAQAQVDQLAADLQVKQAQSARRQRLTSDATTPEEQQVYAGSALEAKAAYNSAVQQLTLAQLNLKRTMVTSPVNGYVTNLLLRVGDFATQGASNISVVDSNSFWIDGYFEETKLSQVCLGDQAEAKLMSYPEPLIGHVETITRGISVSNAGAGAQGLPNVDPVYTWVRLAQRIPVRVAIDKVPSGVPLVSGMTATVAIRSAATTDQMSWLGVLRQHLGQLPQLFSPPMPRSDCLGAEQQAPVAYESLSVPQPLPEPSPKQIDPGLVPGLNKSPRESNDIRPN